MRIIVTGGGTGGHIFPALEIIKELKKQNSKADVLYVGNKGGLEEQMAKALGISFIGLSAKKIVGQSFIKKLEALWALGIAIIQSIRIMSKNRPKAVVGVGGYISAPVLIGSLAFRTDRYVCEQNVVPGLANAMLSKIAKGIFLSFEESLRFFPKNSTILSGNPVRSDFFALPRKEPTSGLRILVTGGSLGAHFLNREIPKVLVSISRDYPQLLITHQAGQKDEDTVMKAYEDAGLNAKVVRFINDMPKAFREHDLIISRAGATVIAEIMAAGMPAILVPYPFANGHQQHNASALADKKAAIMVLEGNDFEENLASELRILCQDPNKLLNMASKAKTLGKPNAAFDIAKIILNGPLR